MKELKKGYYNENTLAKFRDALTRWTKRVKNGDDIHVSFSAANNKMGAVSSVSTLPFTTCPGICAKTCGPDCYAAKLANMRPNLLESYAKNTALALFAPIRYWKEINEYLNGVRFFRFHVSGDIINYTYFVNMVDAALSHPHCEILAFTKRYDAVNKYLDTFGDLPSNLHILFSGWHNLEPVNPYELPETNVYERNEEPRKEWLLCGGTCFDCGCRGVGCWQAKRGDVIAFRKH